MSAQTAPLPPQNLDAEESIVGALMLSPHAIMAAVDAGITRHDFYRASHGKMFEAAVDLDAAGTPVDAITLADELDRRGELAEVGGTTRLHELATLMPAASNAGHYAKIVKEMAQLRGLTNAGDAIARLGWERPGPLPELLDQAERIVFDVTNQATTGEAAPIVELLRDEYRHIQHLYEAGEDVTGVPSGWPKLDAVTTGLQPGSLVIVAARPSMGKTAFALNYAVNAAQHGKRSLVFSLEMSKREVAQRMIASESKVEGAKIRTGRLSADDWHRIAAGCKQLASLPIEVDDTGTTTIAEIRSKARRAKMQHDDLALVVVDYLQLIAIAMKDGENRAAAMGEVSRSLKMLARDLNVPVVALAQLSRAVEARGDRRPILSDLRDSGAIEQDADIVVFLYRDDYYHDDSPDAGTAEVIVAKHRNGPTDTVRLAFTSRYSRFEAIP